MDKKVSRKIKRRRKRILINRCIIVILFLAFFGGIIFGSVKLLDVIFSVNDIYVVSNELYDKEELVNASGITKGENLLFLDTSKAESKICKNLAYVESAKVTKKFLSKVEIEAQIARARFLVSVEDSYLVLSKNHKFLEKKDQPSQEAPSIVGLEFSISEESKEISYKDPEMKEIIDLILNSVEKNHLLNVRQIDLSDKNNIKINFDDRVNIVLGNKNDMDYKILTAHELVNSKIRQGEKGTLDLSKLPESNRSYFSLD